MMHSVIRLMLVVASIIYINYVNGEENKTATQEVNEPYFQYDKSRKEKEEVEAVDVYDGYKKSESGIFSCPEIELLTFKKDYKYHSWRASLKGAATGAPEIFNDVYFTTDGRYGRYGKDWKAHLLPDGDLVVSGIQYIFTYHNDLNGLYYYCEYHTSSDSKYPGLNIRLELLTGSIVSGSLFNLPLAKYGVGWLATGDSARDSICMRSRKDCAFYLPQISMEYKTESVDELVLKGLYPTASKTGIPTQSLSISLPGSFQGNYYLPVQTHDLLRFFVVSPSIYVMNKEAKQVTDLYHAALSNGQPNRECDFSVDEVSVCDCSPENMKASINDHSRVTYFSVDYGRDTVDGSTRCDLFSIPSNILSPDLMKADID